MRTKQVFPTDEIAHLWINERQNNARNSAGNFSFWGRTIKSYSTVQAEMYSKDKNVVFVVNYNYSNTTAKHVWNIRSAIPSYKTVIYCSKPGDIELYNSNFWANIESYYKTSLSFLSEASKPRKRANTILEARKDAVNELEKIETFLKVFGLTIDTLKHKTALSSGLEKSEFKAIVAAVKSKEAIIAGNDTILSTNKKAIDKANKQAENRRKKEQKELILNAENNLKYWLKGEDRNGDGEYINSYSFRALDKVYLRAIPKNDSTQVETTMGARVDIKRAKILYSAIKAGKDILGFDIDGYTVVEKNEDSIKIGCHILLFDEINRFAKLMKW